MLGSGWMTGGGDRSAAVSLAWIRYIFYISGDCSLADPLGCHGKVILWLELRIIVTAQESASGVVLLIRSLPLLGGLSVTGLLGSQPCLAR